MPGRPWSGLSLREHWRGGVAEWLRQGPAKPCTRVRFPPPPRAISSVGERFLDTEEVTSSILVSPTQVRSPAADLAAGLLLGTATTSAVARVPAVTAWID